MSFSEHEKKSAIRRFRDYLADGEFSPGDRLPGEAVLCREVGISRHMLRLLLSEFSTEGLIARHARSGSYLVRRPDPGRIPLLDRGWAPTGLKNRTVSLMLGFPVPVSYLEHLQRIAMNGGFLLQTYFSGEHCHRPEDERQCLEQAISSDYAGALIHATPVSPVNEDFFRLASAQLRIAHIGYHGDSLPAQSFFLPDFTAAGMLTTSYLVKSGFRRITIISALPETHHVCNLIRRGVAAMADSANLAIDFHHHTPGGRVKLQRIVKSASRHRGFLITSWGGEIAKDFPDCSTEQKARCAVIRECDGIPVPDGIPVWTFNWLERVSEALSWLLSEQEVQSHRLYLPKRDV